MLNSRDLGMMSLGAILLFSGLGAISYYGEYVATSTKMKTENNLESLLKAEGYELVKDDTTKRYSVKKL